MDENTYPGLYPDLFAAAGRSLGRELFFLVADLISHHLGGPPDTRQDLMTATPDTGLILTDGEDPEKPIGARRHA